MQPEELQKLIVHPESDVLEYKIRLPSPHSGAKLISAFANTKGGILVVGVKEDREGNEIVDIDDPVGAQRLLEQATRKVSPSIDIHSEIITLDDKSILVATVPRGQHIPYLVDGQAFQRIGDRNIPTLVYLLMCIVLHIKLSYQVQTQLHKAVEL